MSRGLCDSWAWTEQNSNVHIVKSEADVTNNESLRCCTIEGHSRQSQSHGLFATASFLLQTRILHRQQCLSLRSSSHLGWFELNPIKLAYSRLCRMVARAFNWLRQYTGIHPSSILVCWNDYKIHQIQYGNRSVSTIFLYRYKLSVMTSRSKVVIHISFVREKIGQNIK